MYANNLNVDKNTSTLLSFKQHSLKLFEIYNAVQGV